MVKRRPHTVIVKTSGTKIVGGELVNDVQLSKPIKARFEHTSTVRKLKTGDEIVIEGIVFTDHEKITDARYVEFEGADFNVVEWEQNQSYGCIYVKG